MPQEFVRWSVIDEAVRPRADGYSLAPLVDTPTQRHSGLRSLRYMSIDMPMIASPVGALHKMVVDGDDGPSARDEWRRTLERLVGERDVRLRLDLDPRRCVEARRSFNPHKGLNEDSLRGLSTHGGA